MILRTYYESVVKGYIEQPGPTWSGVGETAREELCEIARCIHFSRLFISVAGVDVLIGSGE